MSLEIGAAAPGFSGNNVDDQVVSLSDFRGRKNVFVVFYFADFSPVCSTQLTNYHKELDGFASRDTQVIAISRDSGWSHKAFCDSLGGIDYPVLSDLDLKIASDYGINLSSGANNRAEFLVDKEGIIRWMNVEETPGNDTPTMDDIFKAIDNI